MPIYEYKCLDCGKKSSFVTLSIKSPLVPKCENCGSEKMEKVVSRVAIFRSEESRMESLADPSKLSGLDESDPRSVARWMRRMGKEMGEEGGEDFDQVVEEAVEESEKAKREEESPNESGNEEL